MIEIGPKYAWSILAAAFMNVQCIMVGFQPVKARTKYKINAPDMGNGRQSAKLTDEEWEDLNRTVRIHQNYVEQLPSAISSVLICGLFHPTLSAVFGGAYLFGRFIYMIGYRKKAGYRKYGFILFSIPLVAMIALGISGAFKELGLCKFK
ncbi:hypothetical protein BB560_005794 [Smittium megazygosporum]|uniref:Glutathione transferase n=1 Tax=Smittium megazygosporum TaxID=133381 RepID=A0A2T9YWJ5_9FUNG|nr:hypothetical protein BB560_005794 [Smittium megazygosporum]